MCDQRNDTTTQDEREGCGDPERRETERGRDAGDWLEGPAVLDAQLPDELRSALGAFVGGGSIDTLREWAEEIRHLTGGGSIAVEQLCHASEETEHWGVVGDERYYFQCFYDAVVLAALEERPIDIHTVSPGGTVVEARAVGSEELSVTPASAVFSLGIDLDAREQGGDPTLGDGYAAICPYVRAFPDRDAYEQWAESVPAVTVATSLAGATELASVLTA